MGIHANPVRGNPRGAFAVTAGCLAVLLVAGCAINPAKPPVTVEEIVQMGQQGIPPDTIIDRIKESHAQYQLPASELVALGEEGVPGPVLDYMQQTHFRMASQRAAEEYDFQIKSLQK